MKKILSLILSVLMIVSMMPMNVLAFTLGDLQDAIDNAENGETITVPEDVNEISVSDLDGLLAALENDEYTSIRVTDAIVIPAGEEVTIDISGKEIYQKNEQTAAYSMIVNNGTLTIKDSVGDGYIRYTDTGTGGEYVSNTILNNGTLTVESGAIENKSSETVADNGYPHAIDTNGALVVNGGEITSDNYSAVRIWCTTDDNTSVVINDGTFTGSIDLHNVNGNANKGTLVIDGGVFNQNNFTNKVIRLVNFGTDIDELSIDVTGGEVNGIIGLSGSVKTVALTDVVEITGGTFTEETDDFKVADYVPEGYEYDAETGEVVEAAPAVAKIGETGYATLAEAIAAAVDGDTVTLINNVTSSEIIVVDKAITLDGNDKTITSTAGRAINVSGANGVTIKNVTINASGERAINVIQGATNVTVENVTATAANYTVNVAGSAANAVVTVKNSNLTGLNVVNVGAASADVTVTGGTLKCNDQSDKEEYAALFLNTDATDATITATGVTFDIKGDSAKAYNSTADGIITIDGTDAEVVKAVAYISYGDNSYVFTTLAEALEKAAAGDTVTLINDVTSSEILVIDEAITLDGNGKTITSTAGRAINVSGANGVTIKNVTINASGERAINVIQGATNVTVENVTATAANYTVNVAGSAANAVVTVKNSNLTGLNVVNVGAAGANVTVNGGTITCNDQNNGENYSALALNKDATGATITANGVTFEIKDDSDKATNSAENGKITIDGSTDEVIKNVAYIEYGDYHYAFATLAEAFEKAKAGDTIVLINDVVLEETLVNTKNVTLDLNGKTISQSKACTAHYTMIENKGNLTITGNGKISFTDTGAGDPTFGWGSYTITNRGTLVVENGTIEHLGAQNTASGVVHMYCAIQQSAGTTTINGGTISTPTYRSVRANGGTLNITGGVLDGQVWIQPNQSDVTLEITGGEFSPNGPDGSSVFITNAGENYTASSVSISGGEFATKIGATNATALGGVITGGTFTEAAVNNTNSALLAEGLEFVKNADGTYGVDEAVVAPALPDADVTTVANFDLTFAKNFKVGDVSPEQLAYYKNWYTDFELTVNKDVTFYTEGIEDGTADGYLSGQYDEWSTNWVNVPFNKAVTLKAGETIKVMEFAAELMNQSGLKLTFNDVYTSVKDFDCGVFFTDEFLEANPDIEVTLELRMYNPANEEESYTIGDTYIFTLDDIVVPELPTATVATVYNPNLTFAKNFKADEITADQLAYYGSWYADFELTINKEATFNANGGADGYLSGQYDKWSKNWVNVPFKDVTLAAGETLKIMEYAAELMGEPGLKYTYKEVYEVVEDFDCGVFFEEAYLEANPDIEVKLELRMYNPKDETESYPVGPTYIFTLDNMLKLPTATVTELDPVVLPANGYTTWPSGDKTVDRPLEIVVNFKADETFEEAQNSFFAKWPADFYVSIDNLTNDSFTADNCYLAGNYGDYNWIAIPLDGLVVEEGVEYPIVSNYDANLTYENVCEYVRDFTAAIHIDSAILEANRDIKVTLALKIKDPVSNELYTIGDLKVYTFNDLIGKTYVAQIGETKYETLADAFEAAKADDTIVLLDDIAIDTGIANAKTVTLDLNGKTITGTDKTNANFGLITNTGDLTIKDSVGEGKITLTATQDTGWSRYSAVIANTVGGKLTVESGTIEHLGGHTMAYGIDNLTNGKGTYAETVITGGTVASAYIGIRQFLNGEEATNKLTISGGTVTGANSSIYFQDPSAKANSGELVVTDTATLGNRVYLDVTEGSTEWPVAVSVSVTALGTNEVVSKNVPEGYLVKVVDNAWTVVKHTHEFVYDFVGGKDFTCSGCGEKVEHTHVFVADGEGVKCIAEDTANCLNTTIPEGTNIVKTGAHSVVEISGAKTLTVPVTANGTFGGIYFDIAYTDGVTLNADKTAAAVVDGWSVVFSNNKQTVLLIHAEGIKEDAPSIPDLTDGTVTGDVIANFVFDVVDGTESATVTITTLEALSADSDYTALAHTGIGAILSLDAVAVVASVTTAEGVVTYYETLADAFAAAEAGDTVTLLDNVTIADTVAIEEAITLDLGGKKLTSTAKKAIEVYANATVMNGTIEAANRCVDTRKAVELTLTDVTLVADNYTSAYGNPQPLTIGGSEDGTKVTMNNVNISAAAGYGIITFVKTELTATDSTIGGYNALYVKPGSDDSKFTFVNTDLSGSNANNDVEGNSFSAIALRANDVTVDVDADSSITATGNYYAAISLAGTTEVPESVTGAKVTVKGTITGNVLFGGDALNDNEIIVPMANATTVEANGYGYTDNGDGTITIKEKTYVAQIGETKYETLADAFAAATTGDTVTLIDNVTLEASADNGSFVIPETAGKVTLDLDEYDITAQGRTGYEGRTQYAFDNYADLTIIGNGTIYSRGIQNYGKLTVEDGVTVVATDENGGAGVWGYEGSETVINGGTFTATGSDAGCINTSGALDINGGTFTDTGKSTYAVIFSGTTLTVDNATISGAHGAIAVIGGEATITSGTFTCTNIEGQSDHVVYVSDASLTVNGGTYIGAHDAGGVCVYVTETGTASLTAGTYTNDVSAYCADGYVCVDNGDGTYTVEEEEVEETTTMVSNYNAIKYGRTFVDISDPTNELVRVLLIGSASAEGMKSVDMSDTNKAFGFDIYMNGVKQQRIFSKSIEITQREVKSEGSVFSVPGTDEAKLLFATMIAIDKDIIDDANNVFTYSAIINTTDGVLVSEATPFEKKVEGEYVETIIGSKQDAVDSGIALKSGVSVVYNLPIVSLETGEDRQRVGVTAYTDVGLYNAWSKVQNNVLSKGFVVSDGTTDTYLYSGTTALSGYARMNGTRYYPVEGYTIVDATMFSIPVGTYGNYNFYMFFDKDCDGTVDYTSDSVVITKENN